MPLPLPSEPRILFLASSTEDYLADSLLHGLIALLGDRVVDAPRVDHLYDDFAHRTKLYGRGFSLYARAHDARPLRTRFEERLARGEFDLVVVGNIHRAHFDLTRLRGALRPEQHVAVLDGEDSPVLFPTPRVLLANPALVTMHFREHWLYFKREWTEVVETRAQRLAHALPLTPPAHRIRPISFSIPADVVLPDEALDHARTQDFPHHIVDPEVAECTGRATKYAFSDEAAYHADLASSRFGITTKRAGWDCLRHYELAARGAIPCFRRLSEKPERCAPHGLDASNTIEYRTYADLRAKLDALSPERERSLRANALRWAREHTTIEVARRFLETVRRGSDQAT